MDILSGSYSGDGADPMAGHFQVLWGEGNGVFKKAEALKGDDDNILEVTVPENIPEDIQDLWRICTRPTAVDWDGDGKLDLVVGNFRGSFVWFKGEGKGVFSAETKVILSGGKALLLEKSMHSDPVVVDWDGDGDLDLLSGAGSGGVQWAENTAGKGKLPNLATFKPLIDAVTEQREPVIAGEVTEPSSSSRIWVSDVNGDGKMDITLGDNRQGYLPADGITIEQAKVRFAEWQKKMAALEADRPADKNGTEKHSEKVEKLYTELQKFVKFAGTGHVWLYLQK